MTLRELQSVPLKEIKPICLRVLVNVKKRQNQGETTLPIDIKSECGLNRTEDATGYIRYLEKKGLVKGKRNKNIYVDVRMTSKGDQYLNDHLLIPYKEEVRKKILMIEKDEFPEIQYDENIENLFKQLIPKITIHVHKFMRHEYSTVIPDNNLEKVSQKIQEFFSQEFTQFKI